MIATVSACQTEVDALASQQTDDPERGHGRPRIAALEGIRGVAAFYVLLDHMLDNAGQSVYVLTQGWAAVDVFFVLSGFVLMLPMARSGGEVPGGLRLYTLRRAVRILPPYYMAMAFALLLLPAVQLLGYCRNALPIGPVDVLAHLAMIHNLRGYWMYKINPVFWSVGFEWQLYFLLPLVMLPLWRVLGSAAVCLVCFGMVFSPHVFPLQHIIAPQAAIFSLGIAAAGAGSGSERTPSIAALILACVVLSFGLSDGLFSARVVVGGITAFVVISLSRRPRSFIGRLLCLRPLLWLGMVSYSLYLTHTPVVAILEDIFLRLGFSTTGTLMLQIVVGIPACLAVAYASYLAVERPSLRLMAAFGGNRRALGGPGSPFS